MKVSREKTEDCQAFLTIEMESAEVEESLEAAYRRLVGRTRIPGFRKGKAPRAVLERYIGKESVLDEAIDHLLPQAYEKAIKEQEIDPIARPHIDLTQTDPLIFKAVVPLSPSVELSDYHNIKVEPAKVEKTEDNIAAVIEELRHQHAVWEPAERPADFGDLIVLNVESTLEDKPFINQQGVQYQAFRDSPSPVPGFAEQLAGMKKGEDKEFKLKFPADYSSSELADKEVSFKVEVLEIKQEKLPELNDEFAKQVEPEFTTLDSLRGQISTNLRANAEERAKADFEERTLDAVVDVAQVDFPPVLIEAEIERLISDQAKRLQIKGGGLEEYLKSVNKTEEQVREELQPMATKRVTRSLVLGKIAEEEKIEVADSEIGTEIGNMVGRTTENKEGIQKFLDTERSRESIRQMLMTRKTIDRLTEIAKSKPKTKSKSIAKTGGKEKKQ